MRPLLLPLRKLLQLLTFIIREGASPTPSYLEIGLVSASPKSSPLPFTRAPNKIRKTLSASASPPFWSSYGLPGMKVEVRQSLSGPFPQPTCLYRKFFLGRRNKDFVRCNKSVSLFIRSSNFLSRSSLFSPRGSSFLKASQFFSRVRKAYIKRVSHLSFQKKGLSGKQFR